MAVLGARRSEGADSFACHRATGHTNPSEHRDPIASAEDGAWFQDDDTDDHQLRWAPFKVARSDFGGAIFTTQNVTIAVPSPLAQESGLLVRRDFHHNIEDRTGKF